MTPDFQRPLDGFTRIFDMHMHPGNIVRDASEETLLRAVEAQMELGSCYRVTRFNYLGQFSLYDTEDCMRRVNNQSIRISREWPGIVSGFCYINGLHGAEASRRELDRCLGEGGLVGVKSELEVNPRDPLFRPLAEKAMEYRVPLLQHTWNHSPQRDPHRRGQQLEPSSSDVAWLAREYPELTIIMAHLTGCGVRGAIDVAPFKNVVVDTSGAPPTRGVVESAVRILGPERVLFGSDMGGRDYSTQLGRILGADISRQAKEQILCKNAAHIIPSAKR